MRSLLSYLLDDDDLVVEDPEIVVGADGHRDLADDPAVRVLRTRDDLAAVGTEERLTHLQIHADRALPVRLAVLVERVVVRADAPVGRPHHLHELGEDVAALRLELFGRPVELAPDEEVAHGVVLLLAEEILAVESLLVERRDEDVPRLREVLEERHQGDVLDRVDELDAVDVGLALSLGTLHVGLRVRSLHERRDDLDVREAELQHDRPVAAVQLSHKPPRC